MKGGAKVGFAVVHMMKIKAGAVGGIQSHNNREHPPRTNPDIDLSKSQDNYSLVPCKNYRDEIKRKMSNLVESSRAVRKDAVVVCNFIVTSDQQTMEEMGEEKQKDFFENAVKWFSDRYGADRILNATVHIDETTPHLHIGIVPITADGRLSAKAIFTKAEMKAIQTEFARDVGKRYGLERGVEGSEKTHLSEMRFKIETAQDMANEICSVATIAAQERDEILQELSEAQQRVAEVREDIQSLEAHQRALQGEVSGLERKKVEMERELPALAAQISEARSKLAIVLAAIKEKESDGTAQDGMKGWAERIARAKKQKAVEERLSLLERFVSLPQIKPIWEKFLQLVNRDKSRSADRGRER